MLQSNSKNTTHMLEKDFRKVEFLNRKEKTGHFSGIKKGDVFRIYDMKGTLLSYNGHTEFTAESDPYVLENLELAVMTDKGEI